jgi:metal-responsive CopG/Arc/MetJ family transcriptional regulator
MARSKIAISVDEELLTQVDRWVKERRYPNRSRAIQAAIEEKLLRQRRRQLAEAVAKLDPAEERALAEEGLGDETWPAY